MKRFASNTSISFEQTQDVNCISIFNTAVPTPHEIKVVIAVDDYYKLTVDGQMIPPDPAYWWGMINTHKFTVAGDGPWVVAVEGTDLGYLAGFLGAVYVDGVLKAATGTADPGITDFRTTLNPSIGWNQSTSFDDSLWSLPAPCVSNPWGGLIPNFRAQTKSNASAVWLESCSKVWITAKFRVVVNSAVQSPEYCNATSPECCYVVRSWQLLGKSTAVDPNSINGCCSMTGVTCDKDQAIVTKLDWSSQGLSGATPPHIGNLSNLQSL